MEVYRSDYIKIEYLYPEELLKVTWSNAVENLTYMGIKRCFLNYRDAFIEFCPSRVLFDTSQAMLLMTSEDYHWILENIVIPISRVKNDYSVAYVFPGKFLIRSTMEDFVNNLKRIMTGKRKVFTDTAEAMEWLLKN